MIEGFIHYLLGPSGNQILAWYIEHNLLVNGLVVAIGLVAILAPRQSKWLREKLSALWAKTPFALPEKDRQAVDEFKRRRATSQRLAHDGLRKTPDDIARKAAGKPVPRANQKNKKKAKP